MEIVVNCFRARCHCRADALLFASGAGRSEHFFRYCAYDDSSGVGSWCFRNCASRKGREAKTCEQRTHNNAAGLRWIAEITEFQTIKRNEGSAPALRGSAARTDAPQTDRHAAEGPTADGR